MVELLPNPIKILLQTLAETYQVRNWRRLQPTLDNFKHRFGSLGSFYRDSAFGADLLDSFGDHVADS